LKFAIEESRPEAAEKFWQDSQSASVYIHPRVAESLSRECRWFFLMKGERPVLVWPIAVNFDGAIGPPAFTYFFGPHWADDVERLPASTRHRFHHDGMNAMLDYLLGRFPELRFTLSPQFLDVRPFTWWNYGEAQEKRFVVEPRYTAHILALGEKSDDDLLREFRSVRRQEVRRIEESAELEIVRDAPWDQVFDIYGEVMEKSQVGVSPDDPSLTGLRKLIETGWGFAIGVRRKGEKELGAMTVVLRAKKVANVVLMGARSRFRASGSGAWMTFQTLRELRNLGDQVVDFNGANSPNRGDDKHSYGAVEKLYFHLSYGVADMSRFPG
jgi:hypothetical protein